MASENDPEQEKKLQVAESQKITGLDVEAFTKHAHRSTISMDDVLLCARRNDDLYDILTEKSNEISANRKSDVKKSKKRQT
ncbi:unnamed protein product [Cunninghamella echinulata]